MVRKGMFLLSVWCLSWGGLLMAADLDPALVGWWTFDEGTGDTAFDSSPVESDGKLYGEPQWIEGLFSGALSLDGLDDYVVVGSDPNLTMIGEVTASTWLQLHSANLEQKIMGTADGQTGGYKLGIHNNKVDMEIRTFGPQYASNRNVEGGTVLPTGEWIHVAGVYTRAQSIRTYVNGLLDRELVTSRLLGPTLGTCVLGRSSAASIQFLHGDLDETQVHARALSEAEILALAAPPQKSNDDCENAEPIGDVIALPFDTREASFDGLGTCMRSPNIWFCYTATCNGEATVSLCGSQYDTMLAVYKGCACDSSMGALIACNDDACGLQSEITFAVVAGDKYLIEVGGYASRTGQGILTVTCEGEVGVNFDLADAPDSTNDLGLAMTAYSIPGQDPIFANYPTTFLGNGGKDPQGPLHHQPRAVAHLGETVSLENEAYKGPDEDSINNIDLNSNKADQDGADDGIAFPVDMPSGNWTTLEYVVNVIDPNQDLWLNIWCDWNRDGDWDDVVITDPNEDPHYVVPEWAVQNQYLFNLSEGLNTLVTPALLSWHPDKAPAEMWMRVTLSEVPWKGGDYPEVWGNGGSGPEGGYAYGETEDYFFVPVNEPPKCSLCQDLNGDGKIDMDDFWLMLDEWLTNCLGF